MSFRDHTWNLKHYSFTFLNIFIPKSEERSGTAGLLRLVRDTLAKASVLNDFSSSLHFIVRSYTPQERQEKNKHVKSMTFLSAFVSFG